ncbi:hypothetical protein OAT31_04320, partial [Candidatus Marinimicrobia bacterium]|nr:hypothetical protein [Candidatus Neomarinimicrobiota bacterium]
MTNNIKEILKDVPHTSYTLGELLSAINNYISPYIINAYMLKGAVDDIFESFSDDPILFFDDFDQSTDLDVPAYIRKNNNDSFADSSHKLLLKKIDKDFTLTLLKNLPLFLRKFYSEMASSIKVGAKIGKSRKNSTLDHLFNYPPKSFEEKLLEIYNIAKIELSDSENVEGVIFKLNKNLHDIDHRYLNSGRTNEYSPYRYNPNNYKRKTNATLKKEFVELEKLINEDDFDEIEFSTIDYQLEFLKSIIKNLEELLYEFESPSIEKNPQLSITTSLFADQVIKDSKSDNEKINVQLRLPLGNFPIISSFKSIQSNKQISKHFDDHKIVNILSRHFTLFNKDNSKFSPDISLREMLPSFERPGIQGIETSNRLLSFDSNHSNQNTILNIFRNFEERKSDAFDFKTSEDYQLAGNAPASIHEFEPNLFDYYKLMKSYLPIIYPLYYSDSQIDIRFFEMNSSDEKDINAWSSRKNIYVGQHKNMTSKSLFELLNKYFGQLHIKIPKSRKRFKNPSNKEKLEKYLDKILAFNNKNSTLSPNKEVFLNDYDSIKNIFTPSASQASNVGSFNNILSKYLEIESWYDLFFEELLKECNSNPITFLDHERLNLFDKISNENSSSSGYSKSSNPILYLDIEQHIDTVLEKFKFPDNSEIDAKGFEIKPKNINADKLIDSMIEASMPIRSNIIPLFSTLEFKKLRNPHINDILNFDSDITTVIFRDNKFGKIVDVLSCSSAIHSKDGYSDYKTVIVEVSNSNPIDSNKEISYRALLIDGDTNIFDKNGISKPLYDFNDDVYDSVPYFEKYDLVDSSRPFQINTLNMKVYKNECLYNYWNNKYSYKFIQSFSRGLRDHAEKILFNFAYKKQDSKKAESIKINKIFRDIMHTAKNKVLTAVDQNEAIGQIAKIQEKNLEGAEQFFIDMEEILEHILDQLHSDENHELIEKYDSNLQEALNRLVERKESYEYDQKNLIKDLTFRKQKVDNILNDQAEYFRRNISFYKEAKKDTVSIKKIIESFEKTLKKHSFKS